MTQNYFGSNIRQGTIHYILQDSVNKCMSNISHKKIIINDTTIEDFYKYDEYGNLIEVTTSEGVHEVYKYDERGNMLYYNDGVVEEHYEYDENNRVTKCVTIEVFDEPEREPMRQETTIKYNYDEVGNLIRWETSNHDVCTMEYDSFNRLTHCITEGSSYGSRIEEFYEYDNRGDESK